MNKYKEEILKLASDPLRSVSSLTNTIEKRASNISSIPESPNDNSIWGTMMREFNKERNAIEEYKLKQLNKKQRLKDCTFPEGSVIKYMEQQVFSVLFPALTTTLIEAVKTDSLNDIKSTFNGLDMISQVMWNTNPRYPQRAEENLYIFDMPWAQKVLEENPRPHFPKSWIYTPEIAATRIQAFYRAYLVRKREDVQEVREFWRILQQSKNVPTPKTSAHDAEQSVFAE